MRVHHLDKFTHCWPRRHAINSGSSDVHITLSMLPDLCHLVFGREGTTQSIILQLVRDTVLLP